MSEIQETIYQARLVLKNDDSEIWDGLNDFIPKQGEAIVYRQDVRKLKVGDGVTPVNQLPFLSTIDRLRPGAGAASIIANNTDDNKAISKNAFSAGSNSFVGCFGYYVKAVDFTNKVIYLSNTEVATPHIGTDFTIDSTTGYDITYLETDFTPPPYELATYSSTGAYESGDLCSICNGSFSYLQMIGIVKKEYNTITCHDTLPFSAQGSKGRSFVFWCENHPEAGPADIGESGLALGLNAKAFGPGSLAFGENTVALGYFAIATGEGCQALSNGSQAEGYNCRTGGPEVDSNNLVPGSSSSGALGLWAHAEGNACLALGMGSHVEGTKTFARNNNSHAEGQYTQAKKTAAHAEGSYCIADGAAAHAEGSNCIALGRVSHAGGETCQALNEGAFCHGEGLITARGKQAVFGYYNEIDDNALFIIGRGSADDRRNSFTVYSASIKIGDTTLSESNLKKLLALL